MKKLLTLLMTISLATAAMAQQDGAQSKKKHRKGDQQQAGQEAGQPPANQAPQGQSASQPRSRHQGQGTQQNTRQSAPHNIRQNAQHKAPDADASTTTNATGNTAAHAQRRQKPPTKNRPDATIGTGAAAGNDAANGSGAAQRNRRNRNNRAADAASANDTTRTRTNTASSTAANQPARARNGKAQKPDAQVVQQVKSQHVNFKAQPKPERVPAVTYNQNYRITGAQNWQGTHYEVFRTYRPQWHDQGWYRAHYPRVQIIAGGAYYFSNGFWFPAWGYDPSYQYYAYDAPIYVGQSAEPPDRVIADVQAILQQQGYYKGEVDGLLGPLTREALTEYQTDAGLYATATIDEPTLESLNLG
jgi:hypothetical protein